MAAMHFKQVQRFILAKKKYIFWGEGHFNQVFNNWPVDILHKLSY